MATQVYTFLITYEGLEDKLCRKVQVSSNYHLDQLGYLVLAAFDTLAYHLFEFEYKGRRFELPNDEADLDEFLGVGSIRLYQLKMAVGDRLKVIYDFGTEQVFRIELLSAEAMPKGHGKHYPYIVDGAGKGILDDVHVEETKELIQQIDQNGRTNEFILYHDYTIPWDYREFDIKITNMLLKGEIELIQE